MILIDHFMMMELEHYGEEYFGRILFEDMYLAFVYFRTELEAGLLLRKDWHMSNKTAYDYSKMS